MHAADVCPHRSGALAPHFSYLSTIPDEFFADISSSCLVKFGAGNQTEYAHRIIQSIKCGNIVTCCRQCSVNRSDSAGRVDSNCLAYQSRTNRLRNWSRGGQWCGCRHRTRHGGYDRRQRLSAGISDLRVSTPLANHNPHVQFADTLTDGLFA